MNLNTDRRIPDIKVDVYIPKEFADFFWFKL